MMSFSDMVKILRIRKSVKEIANLDILKKELSDYFAPYFLYIPTIWQRADGTIELTILPGNDDDEITEDMIKEAIGHAHLSINSIQGRHNRWELNVSPPDGLMDWKQIFRGW